MRRVEMVLRVRCQGAQSIGCDFLLFSCSSCVGGGPNSSGCREGGSRVAVCHRKLREVVPDES